MPKLLRLHRYKLQRFTCKIILLYTIFCINLMNNIEANNVRNNKLFIDVECNINTENHKMEFFIVKGRFAENCWRPNISYEKNNILISFPIEELPRSYRPTTVNSVVMHNRCTSFSKHFNINIEKHENINLYRIKFKTISGFTPSIKFNKNTCKTEIAIGAKGLTEEGSFEEKDSHTSVNIKPTNKSRKLRIVHYNPYNNTISNQNYSQENKLEKANNTNKEEKINNNPITNKQVRRKGRLVIVDKIVNENNPEGKKDLSNQESKPSKITTKRNKNSDFEENDSISSIIFDKNNYENTQINTGYKNKDIRSDGKLFKDVQSNNSIQSNADQSDVNPVKIYTLIARKPLSFSKAIPQKSNTQAKEEIKNIPTAKEKTINIQHIDTKSNIAETNKEIFKNEDISNLKDKNIMKNIGEELIHQVQQINWNEVKDIISDKVKSIATSTLFGGIKKDETLTLTDQIIEFLNCDPKNKKIVSNTTVVLDPGHGGCDNGFVSSHGILEKNITLLMAKKIKQKLLGLGFNVKLTREDDEYIDMSKRISFIKDVQPQFIVSIQTNSSPDSSVNGPSLHIVPLSGIGLLHSNQEPPNKETNYESSKKLFIAMVKILGHKNFKIECKEFPLEDLYIIAKSNKPGILIEIGHITNKYDEIAMLSGEFTDIMAGSISRAIMAVATKNDKEIK